MTVIDYREHWDEYARTWRGRFPEAKHIGDEWEGVRAGAARSLEEYTRLIEREFIAPFIERHHRVLEIGVGGGRTSALLLPHCCELVCADISPCMLEATRERLKTERVSYVPARRSQPRRRGFRVGGRLFQLRHLRSSRPA